MKIAALGMTAKAKSNKHEVDLCMLSAIAVLPN